MNYKRFKNTFVWMAANGYKRAITSTVAQFFAFLIVYCVKLGMITFYMGETWETSQMESTWIITVVMVSFVAILGMASVASDMRTNDGRVMLMMLPASNAEKFWARILWLLLSLFGSCVVAIVCADIMRVVISYIVAWPIHGSMLVSLLSDEFAVLPGFHDYPLLMIEKCLLFIAAQSVFVLGGTFFRRRPLPLTVLSIFVISTLFGLIVSAIFTNVPSFIDQMAEILGNIFENVNHDFLTFILNLVTLLFIALHLWAAYKLYCRTQVISNKWINL